MPYPLFFCDRRLYHRRPRPDPPELHSGRKHGGSRGEDRSVFAVAAGKRGRRRGARRQFRRNKKARLGKGVKASHLTYLGDADVGEDTNIGAGVITCNYDGVQKHPTRIGKGAFVGSDSTLVAPITVEDGAYIGAGSCITKDVPSGALAVGRAHQTIKEGWVV